MEGNSNVESIEIISCNSKEEEDSSVGLLQHVKLPSYLADAFQDLYQEDGILVCARGLGLLHLIAAFCRFYVDAEEGHLACVRDELEEMLEKGGAKSNYHAQLLHQVKNKTPLIFVIGLRDYERSCLISILQRWGVPTNLLPTEITNESGQGKDRATMYNRGGIFLITSRILIVDLLTHVASPKDIDGMLVAHAENVDDQSTEAFILRIYRTQKRWAAASAATSTSDTDSTMENAIVQSYRFGFVKAFTDAPDALMSGFAKVDKILKSLFVRKLYIYPRFHAAVADELEKRPPIVEEMHQTLSHKMQKIQASIAAAVQTCIREIKRSTSLIEWSESDLTLENCVTTNFDLSISRQLQHDWHRLKPSTKQLVNDLRQLRTLFHYLLQYDCISFWRLINNIKSMGASARTPSLWLLTPAADHLFKTAKERIFTIVKPKATPKNSKPVAQLRPILEVNPKWRLLHHVLSEIEHKSKDDGNTKEDIRVLVMVKDQRTLETIKSYLVDGKEKAMNKRWLRYLKHVNDRARALAKMSGGSSHLNDETRLLLEEEGRIRNLLFGTESKAQNVVNENSSAPKRKAIPNAIPEWKKKRRRIDEEKSRGAGHTEDERRSRAMLDEAIEDTEKYEDEIQSKSNQVHVGHDQDDDASSSEDEDEKLYKISALSRLRVTIQTYTSSEGEQAYLLLNDVQPTHVILYDAEPSFIRSLEVHSCCAKVQDSTLRVYFMLFESSSEEKNYLKSLEREQNAFERLIQHKKSMPLPVNTLGAMTTQEMQEAGIAAVGSYSGGTLPLSMDTRSSRGKKTDIERRDIAVDVREFRSSLPSILHQGGMRLAPATLVVGDFVLSNVHCIERKSISDLFGSFASGRLYTQAESMSKHYKVPCLLIEFDPAKTFSLQNKSDIGPDIRTDSICSKMALLTMHHPKLRLLWSRSPHETLKLFKTLKANHEEVDVDKAVAVGSNESIDALLDTQDEDGEQVEINEAARDMLLRLPGINIHNARNIMKECDSIAELAAMSREEMKKLLGSLGGQKLFTFFNQKV